MKIALGTVQFGLDYGIANRNGRLNEDAIRAVLDLSSQTEIHTLDTAKAYGKSEEIIGTYRARNPSTSWHIITKIRDKKNILDQIHDSVLKLRSQPIDVLAHSADLFLTKNFQLGVQLAKEKKLTRKLGVSLYCENEIHQVLNADIKPDIIQLPLNILDTRLYHSGVLTILQNENIDIHVRSVFLQGMFYLEEWELKNRFSDAFPYLQQLITIAKDSNLTLAELSLLWVVSLKEVGKVIIGVDNAEQLQFHISTLGKRVDSDVFDKALSIQYRDEKTLNPSLWQ